MVWLAVLLFIVGSAVAGNTHDDIKIRLYSVDESYETWSLHEAGGLFYDEKYNSALDMVVIILGYDTDQDNMILQTVQALLSRKLHEKYNIVAVDLPQQFSFNVKNFFYIRPAINVQSVGEALGDFINAACDAGFITPAKINVVGFSLGAQIAGYLGRRVNGLIQSITGVDPSGIGFDWSSPVTGLAHVSSEDAQFVHIYHSNSAVFGTQELSDVYCNAVVSTGVDPSGIRFDWSSPVTGLAHVSSEDAQFVHLYHSNSAVFGTQELSDVYCNAVVSTGVDPSGIGFDWSSPVTGLAHVSSEDSQFVHLYHSNSAVFGTQELSDVYCNAVVSTGVDPSGIGFDWSSPVTGLAHVSSEDAQFVHVYHSNSAVFGNQELSDVYCNAVVSTGVDPSGIGFDWSSPVTGLAHVSSGDTQFVHLYHSNSAVFGTQELSDVYCNAVVSTGVDPSGIGFDWSSPVTGLAHVSSEDAQFVHLYHSNSAVFGNQELSDVYCNAVVSTGVDPSGIGFDWSSPVTGLAHVSSEDAQFVHLYHSNSAVFGTQELSDVYCNAVVSTGVDPSGIGFDWSSPVTGLAHVSSEDAQFVHLYHSNSAVFGTQELSDVYCNAVVSTGVDPSGIGFDWSSPVTGLAHVSSEDAQFVHLYHSNSAVFGTQKRLGTADYMFNTGETQPGCNSLLDPFCSHMRGFYYYVEALRITPGLPALQCNNHSHLDHCKCQGHKLSYVGFPPDISAKGLFVLRTGDKPAYSLGKNGITGTKCKSKTSNFDFRMVRHYNAMMHMLKEKKSDEKKHLVKKEITHILKEKKSEEKKHLVKKDMLID
ncbi:mucin-4-like [Macrosteles quadrilineatus]|uniref:mucin-4-like n=1 Tax=Macrosteles quadrilineatus TaxID=74068 RepID=UPI0023E215A7|nr:mucin-4-like [Macrosteles quadrilineatus]